MTNYQDAAKSFLPVYARAPVTIESAEGCWLTAQDGKKYLDFGAGVAVLNLGHGHPAVKQAVAKQLEKVWHTSNHFWHQPIIDLAKKLNRRFPQSQVFFCNSGTEANEALIKYARKATGCSGIVALEQSFHGRTCGALSITGQSAKRDIFAPLLPNVTFVKINDVAALSTAINANVGLVIMEAVQGEGGVWPVAPEFAQAARELTKKTGSLLAVDEIQCGVGRTGTFFGFDRLGIRPDLVSMAKGLGNGLPIGALLVAEEVAGAFGAGDHASTFGGNPVACAAANAVLDELTGEILDNCIRQGRRLREAAAEFSGVKSVRGEGLLIGIEIEGAASAAVAACRDRGLITTAAGANVIRLSPPLIVSESEVDQALTIAREALDAIKVSS